MAEIYFQKKLCLSNKVNLILNMNILENQIIKELYDTAFHIFNIDKNFSEKNSTQKYLEKLGEIGNSKNYNVYPAKYDPKYKNSLDKYNYNNDDKSFKGEWIYDLIWIETINSENPYYDWNSTEDLKLVCECEWKRDHNHIKRDFYKLTFSNPKYIKLFIGAIYNNNPPIDACMDVLKNLPFTNSKYLIIEVPAPNIEWKLNIHKIKH